MQTQIWEGKYGTEIRLIPETIAEITLLARMTINAKAEKPEIRLYLDETPACTLWIKNVNEKVRRTSLSNSK